MGMALDQFVSSPEIRVVWKAILQQARKAGGRPLTFTYRCDGPAERRRMQATVTADRHSTIDIVSAVARTRPRPPVPVLDHRITARTDEQIRMCSWCARVWADAWVSIEEACRRLGLLEATRLPAITHGICPPCMDTLTEDLDASPGLLPHNRHHITTPPPRDTLRITSMPGTA
ncbi:hypothetical protein [Actinoplanes xinjiangensis]|uniref:hypothetical protein n=1 Tax=Actinoplanes xinjiangensis TaxID=512350 RepID=UPI003439308B